MKLKRRQICSIFILFLFVVPVSANAAYYGTKADCSTNVVPTGTILYPTSVDENTLTLQTDPKFITTMATTRGGVDVSNPTPIYNLQVTASGVFSSCYTQKEIAKLSQTPPTTLPFDVSIVINTSTVIVGPGKFIYSPTRSVELGVPVYEWKIKGWPSGITSDDKLEQLIKALQDNTSVKILVNGVVQPDSSIGSQSRETSLGLCAPIWGSGEHKIVAMRSEMSDSKKDLLARGVISANFLIPPQGKISIGSLLSKFEDQRSNSFAVINPYATYQNFFSYFVDLKYHQLGNSIDKMFDKLHEIQKSGSSTLRMQTSILSDIASASLCKNGTKLLYTSELLFIEGIAGQKGGKGAIIKFDSTTNAAIHEYSHIFAGLNDEYPYKVAFSDTEREKDPLILTALRNCVVNPKTDYLYNNKLYGSENIKTCMYSDFFKPSDTSIMNFLKSTNNMMFNTVSCGYVIAAIKGGTGPEYWSECAKMSGVIKDGVQAGVSPRLFGKFLSWFSDTDQEPDSLLAQVGGAIPSISNQIQYLIVEGPTEGSLVVIVPLAISTLSPSSAASGQIITVNGTGFDPIDNIIHFKSLTTGEDQTITSDSGDGTMTALVVPTLPDDTYRVFVETADGTVSNVLDLVISNILVNDPDLHIETTLDINIIGIPLFFPDSMTSDTSELSLWQKFLNLFWPADTSTPAPGEENLPKAPLVSSPIIFDAGGTPVGTSGSVASGKVTIRGVITAPMDISFSKVTSTFQYAPGGGVFVDWVSFTLPTGLKAGEKATDSYTWQAGAGNWRFRLCMDSDNGRACGEELSVLVQGSVSSAPLPSSVIGPRLVPHAPLWSGRQTGKAGELYAGPMTLRTEVQNTGDAAADAVNGRFEYSQNGTTFTPWITFSVPSLSPETKTSASYSWQGGTGIFYMRSCVGVATCSSPVKAEIISAGS